MILNLLTILSFTSSCALSSVIFIYSVQQLEVFKNTFKYSVPDFKIVHSLIASNPK